MQIKTGSSKQKKIGITGNIRASDLFYLDSELDFFDKCICFQYLERHVPDLASEDDYNFPRIMNAMQYKSALRQAVFNLFKSYIAAVLFMILMIFSVLLLKYNLNFPRSAIWSFLNYTGIVAVLFFLCFLGYLPFYFSAYFRFCRCGLSFYTKNPELCEKYLTWEQKMLHPCQSSSEHFIPRTAYRLRGVKVYMEPDDIYAILQRKLDAEYKQINSTRRTGRGYLRGQTRNLNDLFVADIQSQRTEHENRSEFLLWLLLAVFASTPVLLIKFTLENSAPDTIAVIFTGVLFCLNLICICYIIYQIRELHRTKRHRNILERFKKRGSSDDTRMLTIREAERKASRRRAAISENE